MAEFGIVDLSGDGEAIIADLKRRLGSLGQSYVLMEARALAAEGRVRDVKFGWPLDSEWENHIVGTPVEAIFDRLWDALGMVTGDVLDGMAP